MICELVVVVCCSVVVFSVVVFVVLTVGGLYIGLKVLLVLVVACCRDKPYTTICNGYRRYSLQMGIIASSSLPSEPAMNTMPPRT